MFFFFWGAGSGGLGLLALEGSRGAVRVMGAGTAGWVGGTAVGGCLVAAHAEDLLEEVLGGLGHLAAGVLGSGAVEEGGVEGVVGAGGVGEEVGGPVDADGGDAFRCGEGFDVGVLGKLDGALHELGPDGRGGVGAFDLDVGVVVVADPDDAEEVGGVSGEPGVVAGAGLAGGGSGEAVSANGSGSGAVVHDAFQQGLGEEGGAGVEDLLGLGGIVGDDIAVGVADAGEHPGREVDAAVGEDGVGAGHVDRRGAVGADGDGWGGAWRW